MESVERREKMERNCSSRSMRGTVVVVVVVGGGEVWVGGERGGGPCWEVGCSGEGCDGG